PADGTPASPAAAGTRDARIAPAWPLGLRVKPVTGEHAMVVTSHPLASDVGVDILRRGGNAVDAAVAIGFALAVGHPVAGQIGREAERLARFPASRAQFLASGETPQPATRFVQADLARTLQLIADSGPQVFYQGSIAELIVQEMARGGGLITRDDLARYQTKWRDPIGITYRGHTIYTMPPPSGGGVTLAE